MCRTTLGAFSPFDFFAHASSARTTHTHTHTHTHTQRRGGEQTGVRRLLGECLPWLASSLSVIDANESHARIVSAAANRSGFVRKKWQVLRPVGQTKAVFTRSEKENLSAAKKTATARCGQPNHPPHK